jgi:aminoglycoside 2'-N-acetyltransferase I
MADFQGAMSAAPAASQLHEIRQLLDAAFDGDFSDDDWMHALGGTHVWIDGPGGVVSHGALVERTLVCSGEALRVGYVEAIATAPAHRRRGHASEILRHITDLIRQQHVLGALSTGIPGFYEPLGWERWRGPTFVNGPRGIERTPEDDGGILILRTPRTPRIDLDGDIVADWRAGDVW